MKTTLTTNQQKRQAIEVSMASRHIFGKTTDPTVVTIPDVVLAIEQIEMYNDRNINDVITMINRQLQNRMFMKLVDPVGFYHDSLH